MSRNLFSVPSALETSTFILCRGAACPSLPIRQACRVILLRMTALLRALYAAVFFTSMISAAPTHAQEKPDQMTMPMPTNQDMHHHGDVPLVSPVYPRMGRSQE